MSITEHRAELASRIMTLYYGGRRIASYRGQRLERGRVSVAHGPIAFPEGTRIEVQWQETGPRLGARVVRSDQGGMQLALEPL